MRNVLKQIFSFILPITATVVIPYILLEGKGFLVEREGLLDMALFVMGLICVAFGSIILVMTIRAFIVRGRGTLAPWSPTKRLVVEGIYAYVRNPMISAVLFILLGEAMVFISIRLLVWLAAFFILNNIYFAISEEPGLIRRFGTEYKEYRANVPKWLPRLKPWRRE